MSELRNIIFEGPDNTGKTSIINILSETLQQLALRSFIPSRYLRPEIHKYSGTANLKESSYDRSFVKYKHLFDCVLSTDDDSVRFFDRAHGGEAIYAFKYRGYDGGYVYGFEKDFVKQHMFSTVVVLMNDTPERLLEREDGNSFSKTVEDKRIELARWHQFKINTYFGVVDGTCQSTLKMTACKIFEQLMDLIECSTEEDRVNGILLGKDVILSWK